MPSFINLNSIFADEIGLNYGQLKLQRSPTQSTNYNFVFPPIAGTTGQALFWNGSETTFRGIAIADVANLQTNLNTINTNIANLSTIYAPIIHDHTGINGNSFTINLDAANTGSDRSVSLVRSGSQSASYSLILPASLGTANQGLIISSISGSSATLGWGNSGGGFSNVSSLSGTSISLDLANGTTFIVTLTQNTTINSIIGIPAGITGIEVNLFVTQDSTGNRSLLFPSGTAITGSIATAASSTSIIKLFSFNGGTSWNAVVLSPAASGSSTVYWTPNNITSRWWLKASDSSSILLGSGVSQWNDRKGNGSVSQSTASSQPAYISNGLNSKNIVRFDGGDTLINAYDIGSIKTIAIVLKQNFPQNNFCGIIGGNLVGVANTNVICLRKSGDPSISIDSAVSSQQFNIVIIQIAPNNAFLRVNGVQVGIDTSYNSFSGSISIGGGGDSNINADIAEILIAEQGLSTTDIEKLEGYLASPQEWGLQSLLPANHPYKSSIPTV